MVRSREGGRKSETKLFGSSGVRGIVNAELTAQLAVKFGLAVATFSKARRVLVARDTRVSGPMLEDALVSGLLAGGTDVVHLGIVPTPVLAYSTKQLKADAGIMITASHNPPQYNGLKVFGANGNAYDKDSQDQVEGIIDRELFHLENWQKLGQTRWANEGLSYLEAVEKTVSLEKEWNVVVDPGCGATYELAPSLLKRVRCHVLAVNAQPDGFFPARSSEPNAETLMTLSQIVKELNVDLAFAYDGDGDRVAFIDENGCFADFDRVLASYSGYIAKNTGGGTIVTNVEASMCVEEMVEAEGGEVIRTKVGDVYVSEAIKQNDAVFGGEPCGAWIHPRFHFCPDGIYSSVMLLEALEHEQKRLSEFVAEAPQYHMIRENIPCRNEVKHVLIEKAADHLKSACPEYKAISIIDGARLTFEEGWALLRASGTEPLLRLTVEGESSKAARGIMKKVQSVIQESLESVKK